MDKRKFRKVISLLLVVVISVGSLPISVFADKINSYLNEDMREVAGQVVKEFYDYGNDRQKEGLSWEYESFLAFRSMDLSVDELEGMFDIPKHKDELGEGFPEDRLPRASEYAKFIISLISLNYNPRDYDGYDYVELLVNSQSEDGSFKISDIDTRASNTAYSIIALDMAGADYNRSSALDYLKSRVIVKDGQAFIPQYEFNSIGDIEETSIGIIALSDEDFIESRKDGFLNYFKSESLKNGMIGTKGVWGEETESARLTSLVIQAMVALEEDIDQSMVEGLFELREGRAFIESKKEGAKDESSIVLQALADYYNSSNALKTVRAKRGELKELELKIDGTLDGKLKEGRDYKFYSNLVDDNGIITPSKDIVLDSNNSEILEIKGDYIRTISSGKVDVILSYGSLEETIELEVIKTIPSTINIIRQGNLNEFDKGKRVDFYAEVLDQDGEEIKDIELDYTFEPESIVSYNEEERILDLKEAGELIVEVKAQKNGVVVEAKEKITVREEKENLGQAIEEIKEAILEEGKNENFDYNVALAMKAMGIDQNEIAKRVSISRYAFNNKAKAINILNISSIGQNPYNYGGKDLVAELLQGDISSDKTDSILYQILALDLVGATYDEDKYIEKALENLKIVGNKNYFIFSNGNSDETSNSLALMALDDKPQLDESIILGFKNYFKSIQKANAIFDNLKSHSKIVQGLIYSGEDIYSDRWMKLDKNSSRISPEDAILSLKSGGEFRLNLDNKYIKDELKYSAFPALVDIYRGSSVYGDLKNIEEDIYELELESKEIKLKQNQEIKLEIQTKKNGKKLELPLVYEVEDEKIASVDKDGILIGKLKGKTRIKIYIEGFENIFKTLEVEVLEVLSSPKKISLEEIRVLKLGDSEKLEAKVLDKNGNDLKEELDFKSSNPKVAIIEDGYLKALGIGETEIIVSFKDLEERFKLTVLKTQEDIDNTIYSQLDKIESYYNTLHYGQNNGQLFADEYAAFKRIGFDVASKWYLDKDLNISYDKELKYLGNKSMQSIYMIDQGRNPRGYKGRDLIKEIVEELNREDYGHGDSKYLRGVLAVNKYNANFEDKFNYNTEVVLKNIKAAQMQDGGFKERQGSTAINTGYALQALGGIEGDTKKIIDGALGYLKSIQQKDGFYIVKYSTTNNTEIIKGLMAVGENLTSEKWTKDGFNPLDSLFKLYRKNGSFLNNMDESKNHNGWIPATSSSLYTLADVINNGYAYYVINQDIILPEDFKEIEKKEIKIESAVITMKKASNGSMEYETIAGPKEISLNSETSKFDTRALGSLEELEVDYKLEGVMVTEINGLKNKGLDGWMYSVNGEYVDEFAITKELNSGDRVLWYYKEEGLGEFIPDWNEIFKEEEPKEEDSIYEFDKNTGTIKGFVDTNGPIDKLEIPKKIDGVAVKRIGKDAFKHYRNKGGIDYLFIPGTVEVIDESAFQAAGIRKLDLEEGIKEIGKSAFSSNGIEEVNLPKSVENLLGEYQNAAFGNMRVKPEDYSGYRLVKVFTDNKVANIKNTNSIINPVEVTFKYVDKDGKQLKEPDTYIGRKYIDYKLDGTKWDSKIIKIDGDRDYIKDYIMDKSYAHKLKGEIEDLAGNYFKIGEEYELEAPEIKGIRPEKKVVSFNKLEEEVVFVYNSEIDLTGPNKLEVSLPSEGVFVDGDIKEIEVKVLNYLGQELNLSTEVEIFNEDALEYLGDNKFKAKLVESHTDVLVRISLKDYPNIYSEFKIRVNAAEETPFITELKEDGSLKIKGYKGKATKELVIPESIDGKKITEIGNTAFMNSGFNIEKLSLPRTIKIIGDRSFFNQKTLKEINLNEGLEIIEERAFGGISVEKVTIPSTVKFIGENAFNSAKIKDLVIKPGKTDLKISNGAFSNNTIDEVEIPDRVNEWPTGNPIFYGNKSKEGFFRLVKVYNDSGATMENTFGVVNPVELEIQYREANGELLETKTSVGMERKIPKKDGSGYNIPVLEVEGSKAEINSYDINYKNIKLGDMKKVLNIIKDNYYKVGDKVLVEANERNGFKPEDKEVVLKGKKETIVFIYGEEEKPDLKFDIDEEIEFLKKAFKAYMEKDRYGNTGNAKFSLTGPGAARLAGMNMEEVRENIYIDQYNRTAYQLSQSIITLIGADMDPRSYVDEKSDEIRNLVEELQMSQVESGIEKGGFITEYRGMGDDTNSVEAQLRSIIALDLAGADYNKKSAIDYLMRIYNGKSKTYRHNETEGYMLLALSNHRDLEGVDEEINKLLAYLKTQQKEDGSFSSKGTGQYSTIAMGRIIQGLVANGIDPLTNQEWIKNGNTIMDAILVNKVVRDEAKKCGYGKRYKYDANHAASTHLVFGVLMDLKNQESMFEKLRLELDETVEAQNVEIVFNNRDIPEGEDVKIYARVIGENGKYIYSSELNWKSSNEKVAIYENGRIKGIGIGKATITVEVEGTDIRDKIEVNVVENKELMEAEIAIVFFDAFGDWHIDTRPTKVSINKSKNKYGHTAIGAIEEITDNYSVFNGMVTNIKGISYPKSSGGWMYYVNDKYIDELAVDYPLKEGDKIIWYCTYEHSLNKGPKWQEILDRIEEEEFIEKNRLEIKIKNTDKSLRGGEEIKIEAQAFKGGKPIDMDYFLISSNARVATFTEDNRLQARDTGSVNITAILKEDKSIRHSIDLEILEGDGALLPEEPEDELDLEKILHNLEKYYLEKKELGFREALGLRALGVDLDIISGRIKLRENNTANNIATNIISIVSAGENPYDYQGKNFVKLLKETERPNGSFIKTEKDSYPSIQSFILLALDMAGETYKEKNLEALLKYQEKDGSFGDLDTTAMVMLALGSNSEDKNIQKSLVRALDYIAKEDLSEANIWTLSALIQGLVAVSEDVDKDIVSRFISLYSEEELFGKETANEQGFLALVDLLAGESVYKRIRFEPAEVSRIEIEDLGEIYEGENVKLSVVAYDKFGNKLKTPKIIWDTSDPKIASVQNSTLYTYKPGNLILVAKIDGSDIITSVNIKIKKRNFKIDYQYNNATNGQELKTEVKISNSTGNSQEVLLIVGLYEQSTNKLINYSMVEQKVMGSEVIELGAGFLVPEKGDYYGKAFVWDGLLSQKVLAESLPIKIAK